MKTENHNFKNGSQKPYKGRKVRVAFVGRALCGLNFATYLKRFATRSDLLACNESDDLPEDGLAEVELAEDPEILLTASNETGEQMLVPFVEQKVTAVWPNGTKLETLQVFDSEAAHGLVNEYNSTLAKLKRTITGLLGIGTTGIPIYYRHPDAKPDHVDSREYGRAENLRVGEDGLYGIVAYNEFGGRLLENVKGLKMSPTWFVRPIPNTKDPIRSRPRRIKSIGLTQFPNIPSAVAVNEKPTTHTMKPDLLKALLTLLAFSNERIDATINGDSDAISITEAQSAFAPFATAANEAKKIPDLEKKVTDLTASNEANETKATDAEKVMVEYKGLLAANEVEAAISSGKIKPCDKDAEVKKLVEAEDFAVACNELSGLEEGGAMKTKSKTDGLAQEQNEGALAANEAQIQFNDLVAANEAKGLKYEQAYTVAEKSPEGKKLLAIVNGE